MYEKFAELDIEEDFHRMRQKYLDTKRRLTGRVDVLQAMVDNKSKIWWWSWEFIGIHTSTGSFLSHRAPARASDLAIFYPELVEHRPIGKFKVYRLRRENMDKVIEYLKSH